MYRTLNNLRLNDLLKYKAIMPNNMSDAIKEIN